MQLLLTILLVLPQFALAQSSDADFLALMKDRKHAEVEVLAIARINKHPADEIAVWYLANVSTNDKTKRDAAIVKADACIEAQPKSAKCHHAAGRLFGAAAMSSGPLDMMKYASRIKDEFVLAAELDASSFDARRDLNQFYLQAPGIAGGSVRKAINNAEDFGKLNPTLGKILRAEVHSYEKEFDKAEAVLAAIKPGGDEATVTALTQAWFSLGIGLINDKQVPRAQQLFERLIATDGSNATLHFALGRAQLEANAVDAAIVSMERALKLDSKLTAHYRLGMAYQQKGDKAKAIAAFQQFLAYSSGGKAADEARKRLTELKGTG